MVSCNKPVDDQENDEPDSQDRLIKFINSIAKDGIIRIRCKKGEHKDNEETQGNGNNKQPIDRDG